MLLKIQVIAVFHLVVVTHTTYIYSKLSLHMGIFLSLFAAEIAVVGLMGVMTGRVIVEVECSE